MSEKLSELDRTRLRWRARRGLLENDLIITAFLDKYEHELTDEDVASLSEFFLLDDNSMLDLLLGRTELKDGADKNMQRLLEMMRSIQP
ncbi:FAD assembly factor SdhE [Basilea psittacipulmonis]|uniref:FAD assembly factor SdhE n=1 Tax=Basilea psittacipulmonis DSM 24701 TaxID=1072685 RepID=A0A077DBJ2_9BURK|nr:succinate dehydrogenase assembly factor 2 [Basilea psittacipulmonis]AIL32210.1 hypothetical protein IX83_01785 [Basilea psittacipulmonis DSM 24701]